MSEATRFRESLDAQQLADALRTRYATRREPSDADELSADLRRLGDIEAIPAVAKPGLTAAPMKAARAVLRALLRPWLAVQTQTNHEMARRLQRVSSEVSALLRRTPEIEESLQQLATRLRELEHRALTTPASETSTPLNIPTPVATPAETSAPTLAAAADLWRMFVHMHLGYPPARVLVTGSKTAVVSELAAFGFDVSRARAEAGTAGATERPSGTTADSGAPTVVDAPYDAVIALPDEAGRQSDLNGIADYAARVLRPGGVLIGVWRVSALTEAPASWRALFDPRVVMIGEPSESGWRVRGQQAADADASAPKNPRSMVMIQAIRLDAPGG